MKSGMFKKVSDILGTVPKNNTKRYSKSKAPSELFDFLSLIEKWEEIVGPKLSKVTVPLKNQKKTLTILTNHSAYSQSLSFMEDKLRSKILKVFPELKGKITKFNFIVSTQHFDKQREDLLKRAKVNKVEVKEKKQNSDFHPQSPQYKKLLSRAQEEFMDMEDGPIKDSLISLFIQNNIKEKS